MGFIATKKSLTSAAYHIDPKNAERLAFERYLLTDGDQCVDPNTLTFDQYHRQADPYSLTLNRQGGSCSAMSPQVNLQAFITRENNVDRPYIYNDLAGSTMYDTMGFGRNMQQTYTGGANNGQGGWYRINMPRESQGTCNMNPPVHHTTDSFYGNRSLSSANVSHYN